MSALLQSMGKVLSLSSPPEASDMMIFRAQLCHVLRLTDCQGVYSLSRKRGHSTMRGHTWGTGSNQAAGVHQTLEWLYWGRRLRRCFCTWNTLGVDSQTFLCFCFNCIKERSLRPVRCSVPTTVEEKAGDAVWSLRWLWEGISGSATVLVCDSNFSEQPSLSFSNHCFPLMWMPFWASISLQHYPTCMLSLPLDQAHINTNNWDHCSFAPAWQAAGWVSTTLCIN